MEYRNLPDLKALATLREIVERGGVAEAGRALNVGQPAVTKRLRALERWMSAFTPEDQHWPGRFSIISLRTDRLKPPRVSLYLRPVEFEMQAHQSNAS